MQLIALEGADGAGKSTQAALLAERLQSEGYRARCVRPVFLLFDPWRSGSDAGLSVSPRERRRGKAGQSSPSPHGRVRSALLGGIGFAYALLAYAYLRTSLRREQYVICDRYFYQFFYDLGGPMALKTAQVFPQADWTFLLDASPAILRGRKKENVGADRYLDSVIGYYRGLASALELVRIDADQDAAAVSEMIWRSFWGSRAQEGA